MTLLVASVPSVTAGEGVSVDTVLRGLNNPCGVAVRPGGSAKIYEVFVADTGAGQIVKMAGNNPGSSTPVVTGFPTQGRAMEKTDTLGPRGLLFLGPQTLVVACFRELHKGNEQDSVRLFELPTDEQPVKSDTATRVIDVSSEGGEVIGVVRFYAVARTHFNSSVPNQLVVTGDVGNVGGWIGKASLRPSDADGLEAFLPSTKRLSVLSPAGIAVGEKGYVVVGQRGLRGDPRALLVFYNPIDGVPILTLKTDLHMISGLAYSHETGNLYATDYATDEVQEGGVFRIDDASRPGKPACKVVKIATIERPTALAFGPDGALYVTACGFEDTQGVLVRITGNGEAL